MAWWRGGAALLLTAFAACGHQPATRLDPQEYRSYIGFIDNIVFTDGPLDPERQDMLAAMLSRLGQDSQGDDPLPASQRLGRELATLEGTVRALDPNTPTETTPLRAEWSRIRGETFGQAAWFRNTPADPEVGSPMPRRAAGVENLEQALTRLTEIANKISPQIMEQPRGSPERRRASEALQSELDQLDSLVARDPGPGARASYLIARNETSAAVQALRDFIKTDADTSTGSPGRMALQQLEQHLKAAGLALEQADGYQ